MADILKNEDVKGGFYLHQSSRERRNQLSEIRERKIRDGKNVSEEARARFRRPPYYMQSPTK